ELAETHSFPDHHVYSFAEIAMLNARAKQNKAALITTEKDHVRLSARAREGIRVLPVLATFDDPRALARVLDPLLAQMVAHP
ncbi:MAG TPA: tetraacyldisaccharide 4'-kinase, partial [Rhizomicrobium sp.]